jgi:hypothetical protein
MAYGDDHGKHPREESSSHGSGSSPPLLDNDGGGLALGPWGEKVGLQPFLMLAELVSRCVVDLSALDFLFCRPLPPPPPSIIAAILEAMVAEELQELLLTWEEELM